MKLKREKKELNNILRDAKAKLKNKKEKCAGDATLMEKILEKPKIKRQKFHGGTINGVSCHQLLDNTDEISLFAAFIPQYNLYQTTEI